MKASTHLTPHKLVFRSLIVFALIVAITIPGVPNVHGEYPILDHYVNDFENVLTTEETNAIAEMCSYVYYTTGAEILVLIVDTTEPDTIEMYALHTFEKNGIGSADDDNGVLIVIAVTDDTWRIEIGYGLEGALPDAKVGTIGSEHLAPYLAEGKYFDGIYKAVDIIGGEIVVHYEGSPPEPPDYPIPFIPLTFWPLVIVIGIMVAVIVITKGQVILWLPNFVLKFFKKKGGKSGGGGASGEY